MSMKNIGIGFVILGILMMVYTGFDFITKEKVVDIGPIEVNKEKNHETKWSPVVGLLMIVGGVAIVVLDKKI